MSLIIGGLPSCLNDVDRKKEMMEWLDVYVKGIGEGKLLYVDELWIRNLISWGLVESLDYVNENGGVGYGTLEVNLINNLKF